MIYILNSNLCIGKTFRYSDEFWNAGIKHLITITTTAAAAAINNNIIIIIIIIIK